MQIYQHRVIEERDQLADRLDKLYAFSQGTVVSTLSITEQERLQKQYSIMQQYLTILNQRIDAFL